MAVTDTLDHAHLSVILNQTQTFSSLSTYVSLSPCFYEEGKQGEEKITANKSFAADEP